MYTLTEIEEKRKRNIFSNTNQQNLGRIHLLANSLRQLVCVCVSDAPLDIDGGRRCCLI